MDNFDWFTKKNKKIHILIIQENRMIMMVYINLCTLK